MECRVYRYRASFGEFWAVFQGCYQELYCSTHCQSRTSLLKLQCKGHLHFMQHLRLVNFTQGDGLQDGQGRQVVG